MPVFALVFLQGLKSFWTLTLLPLLAKIPWQVWVAIAVAIAFFWYGHVRENRGVAKCEAQVEVAKNAEIQRQQNAASAAVEAAKQRETEAKDRLAKVEKELDNARDEASKLKEANKVCLPRSVTDKLRGVRSKSVR